MDENINVVNENEDVVVDNDIADGKKDEFKDKVTDVVEKIRTPDILLYVDKLLGVINTFF